MALDVRNLTKRPAPRLPFAKVAAAALPGWDISLVFVGSARAKALNQKLRSKDYVPNVLSYQSGTKSGEIIICSAVAMKEAASYELSSAAYQLYLFIHGLMHLKGHRHGTTMEVKERALLARFISSPRTSDGTTYRHRDRHRHASDESRRR